METLSKAIFYILGEVLGDSSFFLAYYSDKKIVPLIKQQRKNYVLMPALSVFFSMVAIGMCAMTREILRELYLYIVSFYPGIRELKNLVLQILNVFPNVSSMYTYMFFYRLFRNKGEDIIVKLGCDVNNKYRNFLGIYCDNELTGESVLSKEWEKVSDHLSIVILVDLIILGVLHSNSVGMPIQNLAYFEVYELIPIATIAFLLELSYFLGYRKLKIWEFFGLKRKKHESDWKMDLIDMRTKAIEIAQADNAKVKLEFVRGNTGFENEIRKAFEQYQEINDPEVQYFRVYLETRKFHYPYHIHCIDTTVRLIQGESIFFATPFYHDIDICIFFPAYMALLRNEKVLILVEDTGNLEEIALWIKNGIEQIPDLIDFWKFDILSKLVDSTDVGIMAFQDVDKEEVIQWQRDFLSRVSFVVIIKASDILTAGQEVVSALASKIGKNVKKCVWLLCDRNAESMIDLFAHLLNQEMHFVAATPRRAKESLTAYWDAECEKEKVWEPANRYLGVEARIAELAGREKIPLVEWYGEETVPIYDLNWILGQYYMQYAEKTMLKPHQLQLQWHIDCEIAGNTGELGNDKFIVVEDYCFNLYEMGRQYTSRAVNKAFVHIISPKYMLRDFMKSEYIAMNADPKYITQFVPEYVDSIRNITLRLIRDMLEDSLSENYIRAMLKKSEEETVTEVSVDSLKKLIRLVFYDIEDAEIMVTYRSEFSERWDEIGQVAYYRIIDERVRKEFKRYFTQASYIDEEGIKRHISRLMLAGHLEQKYQLGQYVTLDGKYYEIVGNVSENYDQSLLVKRASDQINGRKYYRQRRWYKVIDNGDSDNKTSGLKFQHGKVIVTRCYMSIEAYTYGYVCMDSWNNIAGGEEVFNPLYENKKRRYQRKQILKVELPGVEDKDPLTCWLAAMLNEMFCTLYPQYYHLLSVAVNRMHYANTEISDEILYTVLAGISTDTEEADTEKEFAKNAFYILEDSREDMGLLRSIERNFQRIINIIIDYVSWSIKENDDYFKFRP